MYADSIIFVPYASPSAIIAAGVVLPVLSIIAVVLRFYVRSSRKTAIGVDDWLVIPPLFFVIGMGACLIAGVHDHGFGYPTPPPTGTTEEEYLTETNPEIVTANQIQFALNLLMIPAYGFIKLSIIFFYKKIFAVEKRLFYLFYVLTWTMIAVVMAWTVCFEFMFIFGCGKHISAFWGSRLDLATYCAKGLTYDEAMFTSEFILNIILLVMPLPTIWRLHMPWTRKLAITGVLLMAFMAVIASVFRLVIVLEVVNSNYSAVWDEDETIATIYYWGMIEAGLALIACNLPSLKPLFTADGIQSVLNSVRSRVSFHSSNSSNAPKSSKSSQTSESSGGLQNPFHKAEEGRLSVTPFRGDVSETESHIVYVKGLETEHQQNSITVQRDVSVEDTTK
ncbi:uncharacterized protein LY89DRAFT_690381 [Mollisia scopiformis]|uniref:Rhodopsin domain-containing protein n=1 Tax=Mollisia scopiformis TaxID=149040 RepID=A0A132BAA1_MOLSC|nr:uncharacterized protein LY89DRAFT_690381 [Mollisia scopiformis]KUJ09335.1 hypothetical protein LY89DRAFT_690381 [Mollisia scopiformis]